MAVLLGVVTLGAVLAGWLVMRRIDAFLDRGGILDSPQGRANRGVLVYGAPEAVSRLQRAGVRCAAIREEVFPEDGLYAALFALSADDGMNLSLIHSARRADPGIYVLARCNAPGLSPAYEAAGAARLIGPGEPVEALISELGGIG